MRRILFFPSFFLLFLSTSLALAERGGHDEEGRERNERSHQHQSHSRDHQHGHKRRGKGPVAMILETWHAQCAQKLGIALPARGSRRSAHLSLAQREQIRACMKNDKTAFQQAVVACLTNAGIDLKSLKGKTKPSQLDQNTLGVIKACVQESAAAMSGDNSSQNTATSSSTATASATDSATATATATDTSSAVSTATATSTSSSSSTSTSTNTGGYPPPPANHASIQANTIGPKCLGCHSSFGTYEGLMNNVVAGNAAFSKLYVKLNQGHPQQGVVSDAEIQAIYNWIQAGAPNN